jgi:CBS domain-containing protein
VEVIKMAKKVRDAMTAEPRSAEPTLSLVEAARLMKSEDVGSLPIVEEGRLIAVLTDRDIVVRAVAEGVDPNAAVIGDVASRDPVTVEPEQDLDEALLLMAEHQVRRLPVVDSDRLVGVLAQADVAQEAKAKQAGEVVEQISKPTGIESQRRCTRPASTASSSRRRQLRIRCQSHRRSQSPTRRRSRQQNRTDSIPRVGFRLRRGRIESLRPLLVSIEAGPLGVIGKPNHTTPNSTQLQKTATRRPRLWRATRADRCASAQRRGLQATYRNVPRSTQPRLTSVSEHHDEEIVARSSLAYASSSLGGWTIRTSQCARRATPWLTLPPSSRSMKPGSRVPTTIKSACCCSASSTISSAG